MVSFVANLVLSHLAYSPVSRRELDSKCTASRNLSVCEAAVCGDKHSCMGPRGVGSLFSSTFPSPAFLEKLWDCCGSSAVLSESILLSFLSFSCLFFFKSPQELDQSFQRYPESPNTTQDLATEELLRPPVPVTHPPLPSVLSHPFQAPSLNRAPGKPAPGRALAWLPAALWMLNHEKSLMSGERRLKRLEVLSHPRLTQLQGSKAPGRELLHVHQMESRAGQTAGS